MKSSPQLRNTFNPENFKSQKTCITIRDFKNKYYTDISYSLFHLIFDDILLICI